MNKIDFAMIGNCLANIQNDVERTQNIDNLESLIQQVLESINDEKLKKTVTETSHLVQFLRMGKDAMESDFLAEIQKTILQTAKSDNIEAIGVEVLESAVRSSPSSISTTNEQDTQEDFLDESYLDSFILEATDLIEQAEPLIETLIDSQDPEDVNTVFRMFHTLKGLAGFSNLDNVTQLTHNAEQLLSRIRKDPSCKNESDIDLIFSITDLMKRMVTSIKKNKNDDGFEEEIISYILKISDALEAKDASGKDKQSSIEKILSNSYILVTKLEEFIENDNVSEENEAKVMELTDNILENCKGLQIPALMDYYQLIQDLSKIFAEHKCNGISKIYELVFNNESYLNSIYQESIVKFEAINRCDPYSIEFLQKIIALLVKHPQNEKFLGQIEILKNSLSQEEKKNKDDVSKKKNIRVSTEKLDKLFNLVGELITTKNMVVNHPDIKSIDSEHLDKSISRLDKIVRELQQTALSVRTIPLTQTFNKMKRLVRDLSKKINKKIDFQIEGEHTEVDKNIVEKIGDPLIHIIRNAIDHGIGTPEERLENGKPETGTLLLKAMYDSNEIVIIVKDDGKGFNRKNILEKAIKQDILDRNPEDIPDSDVWKLVFEPGFSTAKQVTSVSGRGVGMDVVKKNIENTLRGTVNVESQEGKGSEIILRIPLTLAILDSLILRVGSFIYAVSLEDIDLLFQPKEEDITRKVDNTEIVNFRDELLPVIRLHKRFNIDADIKILHKGILMKVKNNKTAGCLFFDQLIGQRQLVVRPLPKMFDDKKEFLGSMVLEDGNAGMILDVGNIINSDMENK